jgi:hypothetical protein
MKTATTTPAAPTAATLDEAPVEAELVPETPNLPAIADSTDLVVAPTVTQVLNALADDEWLDVEDGHLGNTVQPRLPRTLLNRKVGQPNSGFVDELTGERRIDLDFVWLADTMTRAWWPDAFGKGDKAPACRSRDGISPDPESPDRQSPTCVECPLGKWEAREAFSADEKANPRPCTSSVEVMVYLLDEQRLSLVRFGGMAVSRVSRYLGALNAHVPRKPPIAYVTRCELVEETTDNGSFLVPVFTPNGEIPRAQATPLIELRREKVAEWTQQIAEDLADGRTSEEEGASSGPFDGPPADANPRIHADDTEPF